MGLAWGANFDHVYSAECMALQKPARQPLSMMPLLVILFIVSYGILTLLVFEQGRTIDSQRVLIRQMFQDSTQLFALKNKLAQTRTIERKIRSARRTKSAGPGSAAAGARERARKQSGPANGPLHTAAKLGGRPPPDLEDVPRSTHTISRTLTVSGARLTRRPGVRRFWRVPERTVLWKTKPFSSAGRQKLEPHHKTPHLTPSSCVLPIP